MTHTPELPEMWDHDRIAQIMAEMIRVDPEFRSFFERSGTGGVSVAVSPSHLQAALEALRALPDDAGNEAAVAALVPFTGNDGATPDDGSAWRNRTPYEVGPDFERRAAEATLLALRCMLPVQEEARGWGYCILPHGAPVERQDVVEFLMSLEKPAICVALGLGGALAVGAWSVEPPREGTPHVFERSRQQYLHYLDRAYGNHHVRALLIGEREKLVMTAQEIREWRELYDVLGISHQMDSQDLLASEHDVKFVVRFERMQVSEAPSEKTR